MAHVAIIGANIGGLPTAYELQEILQKETPGDHTVTVASNHANFCFVPSSPWVVPGFRRLEDTSFSLKRAARTQGDKIPPRNFTWAKMGKWVRWSRVAFEKYFIWNMKRGSTDPLFQKPAFKVMGINRLKDQATQYTKLPGSESLL